MLRLAATIWRRAGSPSVPRRDDQRERARARRADAPAVLAHPRAGAELVGFQGLDAVGVDHDIERRARHAQHHSRGRSPGNVPARIDESQVHGSGDYQQPGHDHPRNALPQPSEHWNTHAIDDPGPQELEVVD
jgi:hypothetical protein